jgi:thioredoxin 1
MAEIILTSENFENEVLKSDKNVLVDFWASWCGPCKMLAPTIEAIAEEYDSFKVGKVNVDDEPDLAQAYGISSIPTLILFKDGKAADMMVGLRSKDEIVKWAEG